MAIKTSTVHLPAFPLLVQDNSGSFSRTPGFRIFFQDSRLVLPENFQRLVRTLVGSYIRIYTESQQIFDGSILRKINFKNIQGHWHWTLNFPRFFTTNTIFQHFLGLENEVKISGTCKDFPADMGTLYSTPPRQTLSIQLQHKRVI